MITSLRERFGRRPLVAWSILVLAAVLLAFGSIRLRLEYEREQDRIDARNDAANLVVSALERAVSATETVLRDPEALRLAAVTPDSVTVTMDGDQLEALPYGRLLYHPLASPGSSAPVETFASGEKLERENPAAAAVRFTRLARDAPAPIRAGALIRAARVLEKSGQPDAALASYAAAARLATTAIGDVPTELFSRAARCRLLADLHRTPELRAEALELRELLLDGRWRITRPVFEVNLHAASAWAGAGEPPARDQLALSAAVDRLWTSIRREHRGHPADAGAWRGRRFTISTLGVPLTILVQTNGARTNALIAGPWFVQQEWKERISELERRHHVRVELRQEASGDGAAGETRRTPVDTGLPWTVSVRSSDGLVGGNQRRVSFRSTPAPEPGHRAVSVRPAPARTP